MSIRIIHDPGRHLAAAAPGIADGLGGPGFHEVKRTSRICAGFLEIGGQRCFVKRVEEGSFIKGLIARVRGSRARRIIRGARLLTAAGFAHPQPLLAAEERHFGAVRASWVVSEALGDARVMSAFILGDGRNFRRRKWLSRLIAKEIRRLHDAGLYTRDLQETNLMLEAAGGELCIYFLDLEDFRSSHSVNWNRRLLNLIHLDRSIGRFAARSQRLRFLYNYLGQRPPRAEARALVRRLLRMEGRMIRRKRRNGTLAIRRSSAFEPIAPMRTAAGNLEWRSRY
jgi:tRNA A-37 threonylcarbamoyl transferase component Bud32